METAQERMSDDGEAQSSETKVATSVITADS